ncbi:hypothetical protein [Streptomyces sp. NPDC047841]|uniref:hypothetical protein n=1 Tax=Streptomyces sp. NPDC047841 TaxID=3154708 RepID=UPI0034544386
MGAACAGFERQRRPRAERNIAVSGGLTRGTRPAPGTPPSAGSDERLIRQLTWDTPLSAPPPEPG